MSPHGSLCVVLDDSKKNYISFKKGELLQLSNNGIEVKSLETGRKGIIPTGCVGYSKLELLQLFQFVMTEQEMSLPHPVLQKIRNDLDSNDKKASLFLQSIDDDPTLLDTLRSEILKQYCKYLLSMICFIFLSIKVFVAQYDYQAQDPEDLNFRKGEAVNIILHKIITIDRRSI